jgi:hypothetical protein
MLLSSAFILLRFAAYRQWPFVQRSSWLRANSLRIGGSAFIFALLLAVLKVLVALSYSSSQFSLPFTRAHIAFEHVEAVVPLPSALTKNLTHVMTTTVDGRSQYSLTEAVFDCRPQCKLQQPKALKSLCGMYISATFYIAYLGYEIHRSVCLKVPDKTTVLPRTPSVAQASHDDANKDVASNPANNKEKERLKVHRYDEETERLTLRGKIAKIAIAVTPLMGYLPDISALIKYVLVMMAIGVSLTDEQMISCEQVIALSLKSPQC